MADIPHCKCHDLPMLKNGLDNGKQRWRCKVLHALRMNRYYHDNQAAELYRQYRGKLRRRIAAKRQRIKELEAELCVS